MGAGGDGPCLASWLLRCAETSLSKWNPHPDWQAGRRAPSNRSSQLWLQLWRFPRVSWNPFLASILPRNWQPAVQASREARTCSNLPGSANKLVDIAAHTGRPPAPPGPGPRVQGRAL